jgi:uncharacterized protein YggT (Ycf19 family)
MARRRFDEIRPQDRGDDFRESLAQPAPVVLADERDGALSLANILYVLLGLLEAILALRFVFLIFGANPANGFVTFIYNISHPFVAPFYGIFGQSDAALSTIHSTIDPATIVAMVVYAIIGWALVRLIAGPRANRL